jgi:Copine
MKLCTILRKENNYINFSSNIIQYFNYILQFVNFSEIMSSKLPQPRKEVTFALRALMEIPSQYKATLQLGLLGYV